MKSLKVRVRQKGFKSEEYLQNLSKIFSRDSLRKIAEESLDDFISASPTPEIAIGWSYDVEIRGNTASIVFNNSTFEDGANVAILLDVGHGTMSGKWVPGKNYLKEPIRKTYIRINKLLVEAR